MCFPNRFRILVAKTEKIATDGPLPHFFFCSVPFYSSEIHCFSLRNAEITGVSSMPSLGHCFLGEIRDLWGMEFRLLLGRQGAPRV